MNVAGLHDSVDMRRKFWEKFCPKKNVNIVAARISFQSQRVDACWYATFVELRKKNPDGNRRVVHLINRDRTLGPREGVRYPLPVIFHAV